MKTSLASSPLLPAITGVAALVLIFGTMTNANSDDGAAPSGSPGNLPPVDLPAVDVPAPIKAKSKCAGAVCTVTFAEAGSVAKVFGTTVEGTEIYEDGVALDAKGKALVVSTKKGGKLSGLTVKVTKANAKGVVVTFTKA